MIISIVLALEFPKSQCIIWWGPIFLKIIYILYLIDGFFIYLELMKFSIDFAKTRCMFFLIIFVICNVFKVKFWFEFWLERFMGFGKFVIRLFIIKLIWFGVELLLIFMGWSFIKRFLAWTDSTMRGYIYIYIFSYQTH